MELLKTKALNDVQKKAVFRLWNEEYPGQITFSALTEFEHYLRALGQPAYYLAMFHNILNGWAVAFERDGARWFAIIVAKQAQGTGVGTSLLNALKESEPVLNGWVTDVHHYIKKDGRPYLSPISFYFKNAFEICPDVRLETEKLTAVKIKWSAAAG